MIADRRVMVEVARDLHTLFLCRGVLGVDITDYLISVVFNQFPVTWVVGVKFVGGFPCRAEQDVATLPNVRIVVVLV